MTTDEQNKQLELRIKSLEQQVKDLKNENLALKCELQNLFYDYDSSMEDNGYALDEEQYRRLKELGKELDSLKKIEDGMFHGILLKDVILPDKLEEIGCDVFNDCPNLDGLDIPESVNKIGPGFCKNCPSFKDIWFRGPCPEGLSDAFTGCSALIYIVIYGGEVEIEKYKAALPKLADKIRGPYE